MFSFADGPGYGSPTQTITALHNFIHPLPSYAYITEEHRIQWTIMLNLLNYSAPVNQRPNRNFPNQFDELELIEITHLDE